MTRVSARSRRRSAPYGSHPDGEPVLPAMLLAETRDALVIGDQRTIKLDRRRNEKPVRRVAIFQMMQLMAAAGGPMAKRRRLDAGTPEKPLDPRLDGNIEIDPSDIDQQRDLPGGDGAKENRPAVPPPASSRR